MLKTKDLVNVEFNELDMWNPILASVAYTIRCSHHSTLKATPGQLVFRRDMLLDLKFKPNYNEMWAQKQNINYDNVRENSKRASHNYKVDEYVYIIRDGQYRKLEGDKQGPFQITEVFSNGTVWLQKGVAKSPIIETLSRFHVFFVFLFFASFSWSLGSIWEVNANTGLRTQVYERALNGYLGG